MAYDLRNPELHDLLRSIFWGRFAPGLGPAAADVWQEVCLSMLERNQGPNPFDPAKGSASNYAYMVCKSVRSAHLTKKRIPVGDVDMALEESRPFPWASGRDRDKGACAQVDFTVELRRRKALELASALPNYGTWPVDTLNRIADTLGVRMNYIRVRRQTPTAGELWFRVKDNWDSDEERVWGAALEWHKKHAAERESVHLDVVCPTGQRFPVEVYWWDREDGGSLRVTRGQVPRPWRRRARKPTPVPRVTVGPRGDWWFQSQGSLVRYQVVPLEGGDRWRVLVEVHKGGAWTPLRVDVFMHGHWEVVYDHPNGVELDADEVAQVQAAVDGYKRAGGAA